MKNLWELSARYFRYIVPVIPRLLQKELVRGEHFFLANLLKLIPGSSSKEESVEEPQADIVEGALVSSVRPDQSPLVVQDPEPAPRFVKKKGKIKVAQATEKKKGKDHNQTYQGRRRGIRGLCGLVGYNS